MVIGGYLGIGSMKSCFFVGDIINSKRFLGCLNFDSKAMIASNLNTAATTAGFILKNSIAISFDLGFASIFLVYDRADYH